VLHAEYWFGCFDLNFNDLMERRRHVDPVMADRRAWCEHVEVLNSEAG